MTLAALSFLMSGEGRREGGRAGEERLMVCTCYTGLLQVYVHLPEGRAPCHGDVSLAWQLPQLVLISFAEILVSVTGLELAYSQAPPDLR